MKQWLILPVILLATACATPPKVATNPVSTPVVQKVAVCNASVKRKQTDLDKAKPGMRLEEQNTVMRKSLAQLKEYVIELEASFVECGGKIN